MFIPWPCLYSSFSKKPMILDPHERTTSLSLPTWPSDHVPEINQPIGAQETLNAWLPEQVYPDNTSMQIQSLPAGKIISFKVLLLNWCNGVSHLGFHNWLFLGGPPRSKQIPSGSDDFSRSILLQNQILAVHHAGTQLQNCVWMRKILRNQVVLILAH